MTKKLALIGAFVCCVSTASVTAQEKVIVGGSGALGDAVQVLAKAYKEKYPADMVDVILDPMGTTGGIAAVKIRRLTIGIITRSLSEQEKKEGLVYRPVTRQAVVVGMHKSFSIGDLNESQVCDIFAGKIKSWKDIGASEARIVVVGRKLDDNDMKVFRDKMVCFKNLQLAPEAVLLERGSDVLDALNNRPGTVGVTGAGAAFFERPNIKTAVIAGVSPSLEGVKSGKYKYYSEFGFITIGEPSGTTKRFADFVTSTEGEKILEKYHAASAR